MKTPSFFANLFGQEQIGYLIEENLTKARVRLFQVKMEEEAIRAEKEKLLTRIARLEREQKEHIAKSEVQHPAMPPQLEATS